MLAVVSLDGNNKLGKNSNIHFFFQDFCPGLSENCEKIEKEFLLHYFPKNDVIGLF